MAEMILADDQMSVVSGIGVSNWMEVPLPTGRIEVPAWCKGVHVNWAYGVGNAPDVTVKSVGAMYDWPDQRWAREDKKTYIARHEDGRAQVLYHGGEISECAAYRIVDDAPPPPQPAGDRCTYGWGMSREEGWASHVRQTRSVWDHWHHVETERGTPCINTARAAGEKQLNYLRSVGIFSSAARVETIAATCTTAQGGFGGAVYWLTMLDGSLHALRGPWHGGAPEGRVEVRHVDTTAPRYANPDRWLRGKPWHHRGSGGPSVYLTEDLFLRIIARFAPHVGIARVEHSYGVRLEPYRLAWNKPKALIYGDEHARARRNQPAGEFWRMYWDSRGSYCGTLRKPSYGFGTDAAHQEYLRCVAGEIRNG